MQETVTVDLKGKDICFSTFDDIAKSLRDNFGWEGEPVIRADLTTPAMNHLTELVRTNNHFAIPPKRPDRPEYDYKAPIDTHRSEPYGDIPFSLRDDMEPNILARVYGEGFPTFIVIR